MEVSAAVSILRQYQAWRRGKDSRTLEECGLTPQRIGDAIDAILLAHTDHERQLNRAHRMLTKCIQMRDRYARDLRKRMGGE